MHQAVDAPWTSPHGQAVELGGFALADVAAGGGLVSTGFGFRLVSTFPNFRTFVGNIAPEIGTLDEAMKRRFLLAPFETTPANPDKDLERKLQDRRDGVLALLRPGELCHRRQLQRRRRRHRGIGRFTVAACCPVRERSKYKLFSHRHARRRAGIHDLLTATKVVDGRTKPGQDEMRWRWSPPRSLDARPSPGMTAEV
jgi:hypothetical protein